MNGVMIPSVSAGSSQREASVMWTPHVIVPSGAAVVGAAAASSSRTARAATLERTASAFIDRLLSDWVAVSALHSRFLSRAFHRVAALDLGLSAADAGRAVSAVAWGVAWRYSRKYL